MAAQTLHTPAPVFNAPVDITPPQCGVFALAGDDERCPSVVMLHPDASVAQLLGLAHGKCSELATLAGLAANSSEHESELRVTAAHLANGLDMVLATLDAIHRRL